MHDSPYTPSRSPAWARVLAAALLRLALAAIAAHALFLLGDGFPPDGLGGDAAWALDRARGALPEPRFASDGERTWHDGGRAAAVGAGWVLLAWYGLVTIWRRLSGAYDRTAAGQLAVPGVALFVVVGVALGYMPTVGSGDAAGGRAAPLALPGDVVVRPDGTATPWPFMGEPAVTVAPVQASAAEQSSLGTTPLAPVRDPATPTQPPSGAAPPTPGGPSRPLLVAHASAAAPAREHVLAAADVLAALGGVPPGAASPADATSGAATGSEKAGVMGIVGGVRAAAGGALSAALAGAGAPPPVLAAAPVVLVAALLAWRGARSSGALTAHREAMARRRRHRREGAVPRAIAGYAAAVAGVIEREDLGAHVAMIGHRPDGYRVWLLCDDGERERVLAAAPRLAHMIGAPLRSVADAAGSDLLLLDCGTPGDGTPARGDGSPLVALAPAGRDAEGRDTYLNLPGVAAIEIAGPAIDRAELLRDYAAMVRETAPAGYGIWAEPGAAALVNAPATRVRRLATDPDAHGVAVVLADAHDGRRLARTLADNAGGALQVITLTSEPERGWRGARVRVDRPDARTVAGFGGLYDEDAEHERDQGAIVVDIAGQSMRFHRLAVRVAPGAGRTLFDADPEPRDIESGEQAAVEPAVVPIAPTPDGAPVEADVLFAAPGASPDAESDPFAEWPDAPAAPIDADDATTSRDGAGGGPESPSAAAAPPAAPLRVGPDDAADLTRALMERMAEAGAAPLPSRDSAEPGEAPVASGGGEREAAPAPIVPYAGDPLMADLVADAARSTAPARGTLDDPIAKSAPEAVPPADAPTEAADAPSGDATRRIASAHAAPLPEPDAATDPSAAAKAQAAAHGTAQGGEGPDAAVEARAAGEPTTDAAADPATAAEGGAPVAPPRADGKDDKREAEPAPIVPYAGDPLMADLVADAAASTEPSHGTLDDPAASVSAGTAPPPPADAPAEAPDAPSGEATDQVATAHYTPLADPATAAEGGAPPAPPRAASKREAEPAPIVPAAGDPRMSNRAARTEGAPSAAGDDDPDDHAPDPLTEAWGRATVRVHVLGDLELFVQHDSGWESCSIPPLARSVLALLAIYDASPTGPGARERSEIIETLWPGIESGAASARLRRAIHTLRKAAGKPAITTDDAAVSLGPPVASDLASLLRLGARARAALARGNEAAAFAAWDAAATLVRGRALNMPADWADALRAGVAELASGPFGEAHAATRDTVGVDGVRYERALEALQRLRGASQ